jgi:phosphoethanolamine N-methyltransferase
MSHADEYGDNMVRMLELIWGEGYMAPGGPANVARLLEGLEPAGARILDVGCGIGGPAREMAVTHGATVVGIDLEAPLVERANADAEKAGIADRCAFQQVEPGPLPFDDDAFDIVISAGALTQTPDKPSLLSEVHRVLRPGGWLSVYEWMKNGGEYSDDMRYWFEVEGLTYAMVTIDALAALFRDAGFDAVTASDASDWYRHEARREYDLVKGDMYPTLVDALGQADADHFVENWRAMVVVTDKGEMRQAYCRGRKPR